MVTVVLSRVIM